MQITANHYVIALALATVFALWWISRDVAGVKSQVRDLQSHRIEDYANDFDGGDDEPPAKRRVHFADDDDDELTPVAADDDDPIVTSPAPPPAPPPATDL